MEITKTKAFEISLTIFSQQDLEKIAESIYSQFYETCRSGLLDFPSKDEWVKERVKEHKLNYPELYGYIWDELSEDWVFEQKGNISRMINRKK